MIQPPFAGLSTDEVRSRIEQNLTNREIPGKTKTAGEIIFENSFSIFNLVNIVIIGALLGFYFYTGDFRLFLDSLGIISVVFFNTLIAIAQEFRASRILARLELLKNEPVTVIRNSEKTNIDKHQIVQDDVIMLNKGEQVVVDGTVLASNHLEIDESLLTGESLPVEKKDGHSLLSGSYCVYGSGFYKAEKLGDKSYAAAIVRKARKYKLHVSPLLKKVNLIFTVSFAAAILMVAAEGFISIGAAGLTVESFRKVSAIAISLIPEGLVFFSTVTFMIGIIRIAKLGAIIQKVNAIDSFSTVKIVCIDKTGTLTKNNMTVSGIVTLSRYNTEELQKLLGTYSYYSSDKNATISALMNFEKYEESQWYDEVPFSSERKMSALKLNVSGAAMCLVLGAAEVVAGKTAGEKGSEITALLDSANLKGKRNLILAEARSSAIFDDEKWSGVKLEPLCIISMKDEAREDAASAVRLFRKNNIELKIISGDYEDSINSTLQDIGWQVPESGFITGSELRELSGRDLDAAIRGKSVFTRLSPEDKVNIVKALKNAGLETAVIGDGINDLPAIKEASLGIAMEEGSAITKDAADIVLLKNKFTILPAVFDEGNRIINTVLYVSKLMVTKNLVLLLLSVLSWFALSTFPFTPRSSSLINIMTVALPAYYIALKNRNRKPVPDFFKSLFRFVFVSAAVIVSTILLSIYAAKGLFAYTSAGMDTFLGVIILFMLMANFFSALNDDSAKNVKPYLFYGLLLIVVYIFYSLAGYMIPVLNIVSTFYEITPINLGMWLSAAAIIIPASLVLFAVNHFFNKKESRATVPGKV
ncbi:MAG: HAD-IC family P-type ATPase [Ignavibacteria bacterium]|nr:HAD-IC family P-type ATPase [Ignavibacteria bacterium]